MTSPRVLVLVALVVGALVWAFLVAGLGGEEHAGVDRADAHVVFKAAMKAVHDADWPMLEKLLTKEARFTMKRDMERLQLRLGHPQDGKREREIAKRRLGDRYEEEVRRALDGDMAELLRFFVLLSPRAAEPKTHAMKMGTMSVEILYETGEGVMRPVKLVRVRGHWYVNEMQL